MDLAPGRYGQHARRKIGEGRLRWKFPWEIMGQCWVFPVFLISFSNPNKDRGKKSSSLHSGCENPPDLSVLHSLPVAKHSADTWHPPRLPAFAFMSSQVMPRSMASCVQGPAMNCKDHKPWVSLHPKLEDPHRANSRWLVLMCITVLRILLLRCPKMTCSWLTHTATVTASTAWGIARSSQSSSGESQSLDAGHQQLLLCEMFNGFQWCNVGKPQPSGSTP